MPALVGDHLREHRCIARQVSEITHRAVRRDARGNVTLGRGRVIAEDRDVRQCVIGRRDVHLEAEVTCRRLRARHELASKVDVAAHRLQGPSEPLHHGAEHRVRAGARAVELVEVGECFVDRRRSPHLPERALSQRFELAAHIVGPACPLDGLIRRPNGRGGVARPVVDRAAQDQSVRDARVVAQLLERRDRAFEVGTHLGVRRERQQMGILPAAPFAGQHGASVGVRAPPWRWLLRPRRGGRRRTGEATERSTEAVVSVSPDGQRTGTLERVGRVAGPGMWTTVGRW